MSERDSSDEEGRALDRQTGGPGSRSDSPLPASLAERAARRSVLVSEGQDAIKRLGAARADFRNHVFWMAFGASPGALIPMLFAISELGGQALVVLIILMVLVESWRAFQSRVEVKRLEVVVRDFKDRIAELSDPPSALEGPVEE